MVYNKGENNYNKGGSNNPSRLVIYLLLLLIVIIACIVFKEPITQQLYTWKERMPALFDKKADIEEEDIIITDTVATNISGTDVIDNITEEDTVSLRVADIAAEDNTQITDPPYTSDTRHTPPVQEIRTSTSLPKTPPTDKSDKPQTIEVKSKERYVISFTGNNSKRGFKDAKTGEIIIEPQYDNHLHINDRTKVSYLAVMRGNKYGIIDLNNKIVVPFIYNYINWAQYPDYWMVSKYGQNSERSVGLINAANAKLVVPVEFDELKVVGPISFIIAKKNGRYGCIDNNNRITVPIIYNSYSTRTSSNQSNNMVIFYDKEDNKFCFDKNGLPLDCQ